MRGRPTKYIDEMPGRVDEYLASCEDSVTSGGSQLIRDVNLPSVQGLAVFFEVSTKTIYNWADDHPEFLHALEKVEAEQGQRLINNGLSGNYNPTIAKLLLMSNHGVSESQNINHTGVTLPTEIVITAPTNES